MNAQTIFAYHQEGNLLWAEYAGGDIIKGYLLGTVLEHGELEFHYQHINQEHRLRIGKCHSIPCTSDDGKMELHETWVWLDGDQKEGTSILIEK